MKKGKTETVVRLFYEVEVFNEEGPHWYIRRWNFETLEEAREYIKEHTACRIFAERFRIVKSETTIARTLIE